MHRITAKINNEGVIIPSNYYDRIIVSELAGNDIYVVEIKKGRKINSLGKYWLLMSAFAYYRNSGSKEFWHNELKKMFFGFSKIENPFTGEISHDVESISFEKMDEIRFQEYLTWIFEKMFEIGIDGNELINNYIMYR